MSDFQSRVCDDPGGMPGAFQVLANFEVNGQKMQAKELLLSSTNLTKRYKLCTMDWKIFGTAFLTLFLAELGDKTQLAVITMTASTESKVSVFLGGAAALVLVTLIGVLVGGVLSEYIPTEWLQRIVAAAFIVIGVLMLLGKL